MCAIGLIKDDVVLATSALAEFPKLRTAGVAGVEEHIQNEHLLASWLLRLQGHTKLSRNALLKAIRAYPGASQLWSEAAQFLIGQPEIMTLDWADPSRDIFDSATPCAESARAVRVHEVGGTPGRALGLGAAGFLLAGREEDIDRACSMATKAAHENPAAPEVWSAVAAAAFTKGVTSSNAVLLRVAVAATVTCIAQIDHKVVALAAAPGSVADVTLEELRHWALLHRCECLLALAHCDADGKLRAESLQAAIQVASEGQTRFKAFPQSSAPFQLVAARCELAGGHASAAVRNAAAAIRLDPHSRRSWLVPPKCRTD